MLNFMKFTQPRDSAEIARAALNSSLVKRGQALLDEAAKWDTAIGRCALPTNLQGEVENYFGKKLRELDGGERAFAEAVCITFSPRAIADFVEIYLRGRINNLDTKSFIKDFNARLVPVLEEELQNVTVWVQAAFAAYPDGYSIDALPCLEYLRHRLYLTRIAAQTGEGGIGGVQSIMRWAQ